MNELSVPCTEEGVSHWELKKAKPSVLQFPMTDPFSTVRKPFKLNEK